MSHPPGHHERLPGQLISGCAVLAVEPTRDTDPALVLFPKRGPFRPRPEQTSNLPPWSPPHPTHSPHAGFGSVTCRIRKQNLSTQGVTRSVGVLSPGPGPGCDSGELFGAGLFRLC
jgi:hypothetical protein